MTGTDVLKKMLKENNVSGVFLLYGREEYLREYYYSRIKDEVVGDDGESHIVYDGSADADTLRYSAETVSFMGGRKLVELRDVVFKEDSDLAETIAQLCEDLPEYTVLLLNYPTTALEDNKTFEKKLTALLGKNAVICKFGRPSYNELKDWVMRQFGAAKIALTADAADYLLSVADNGMINLKNEIDKIIRYAPQGSVDKKIIDRLVTKSADAKVYELTDALISGKGDVFKLLDEILFQGNDVTFAASCIYNRIHDIYLTKLALEQRVANSVISADLGIKSDYSLNKLIAAARSANTEALEKCVKICADTDVKLKSFPVNSRVLLELCIASIKTELAR